MRETVQERLGPSAYDAWFRMLDGDVEGDRLVVYCPDRFSRDWIQRRYGTLLEESAPGCSSVEYRVDPRAAGQTVRESGLGGCAGSATGGLPVPEPVALPTFESFVVGPANALAAEAARAAAGERAGRCNPLVLTGANGMGKTHLCVAIRHASRHGVIYRSSEAFTTEVTTAMRAGGMEAVRHRYRRSLNVLVLEDVQFLAGKRATQIELFHTLDHLIEAGKTVVLSCDRPPQAVEGLDPNLSSRMSTGLIARIAPPDSELRRIILRQKAAAGAVGIPEECLELLASRPAGSVRDLLAGLNQVVARASLLRRPVTCELVQEALEDAVLPGRPLGIDEIKERTARAYGVEAGELAGRSRRKHVTRPRQIAMYLCRRYTEASFAEIGRAFRRDASTVLHAVGKVEERILERPQERYEIEAFAPRLRS